MVIDSSAQWWRLVDQNWDDLATLFKRHDLGGELPSIERMRRHRDARIARRLHAARKHAPPLREVKRDRRWQLLFDLCAEQWVLHRTVA